MSQTVYVMDAETYARRNPPLPWLYFDPKLRVFLNQQSLGLVYRLAPINLPALPQEQTARLYHALQHALNALPVNAVLQVHERHSTDFTPVLAQLQQQLAALGPVQALQR
ncbi:MAG TPA: TraC family protein, partial [bacterium]|nr:TraC family protein [bacterium]